MRNEAFEQAELTLFFEKVKFRGHGGAEVEGMRLRPYGMVRFQENGQERDYVTQITISWDGQLSEAAGGYRSGQRIFLEPAPVEDENLWPFKLGDL